MKRHVEHDEPISARAVWNVFRQLPERKVLIRAEAPDYIIEEMTDSYAKMLGVEQSSAIGKPYFEIIPRSLNQTMLNTVNMTRAFRTVVRTHAMQTQQLFRHDISDPNGSGATVERYWRRMLYPILDESAQRVVYILQVCSDATAEVLASRELEEARLHLEEALEAGKVGSWSWTMNSDVVIGNNELASIFGLTEKQAHEGVPFAYFVGRVHQDDRDRVTTMLRRSIETKVSFDIEFRVVNGKRTKWVLGRGRFLDSAMLPRLSGVIVDITERRDLQAQIELARRQDRLNRQEARMLQLRNEELQTLSRSKDEFVALASHQLRTPATAVKQYLGMVLQGYAGDLDALTHDMLDKAFESNERQLQIINQILNAARADTGRLIMTPAPFDVVAMVRGVAEEQRSVLRSHSHKLILHLPSKSCMVRGDNGYLRMAVENLINNADKYTHEGGTITVSLKERRGNIRIFIQDTGVGIEPADIEKLFTKFSRVHNELSIKAGGSGIGLYLASEIIKLHGGSITVSSKPGKGTIFTIDLPTEIK